MGGARRNIVCSLEPVSYTCPKGPSTADPEGRGAQSIRIVRDSVLTVFFPAGDVNGKSLASAVNRGLCEVMETQISVISTLSLFFSYSRNVSTLRIPNGNVVD